MNFTRELTAVPTSATLLAAAAIHVGWGHGSSFPFSSFRELTDNVIGSPRSPSPAACNAVAGLLTGAALLVAIRPRTGLHRVALHVVSSTFAARAAVGFAGRTDVLVPGSSSPQFRRNDRRVFSPLCAAIAVGMWASNRL
jgi:hypothetical protein